MVQRCNESCDGSSTPAAPRRAHCASTRSSQLGLGLQLPPKAPPAAALRTVTTRGVHLQCTQAAQHYQSLDVVALVAPYKVCSL